MNSALYLEIVLHGMRLLLAIFLWSATFCWAAEGPCFCGYGGVCRFMGDRPVEWECSASNCHNISGGLYQNCSTLTNHCESNPCAHNGTCVMTFGSFFCKCLPGYIGRFCQNRRTAKLKDLSTVIGPRAWYQVNRVNPEMQQFVYFTFEDPGDAIEVQVRFSDGRFLKIPESSFKFTNAKEDCILDVNKHPREMDVRVCETLLDSKVYSVEIQTRFFRDKFSNDEVYVRIPWLEGAYEGRVDFIHIAVLNAKRLSFSQEFRIHTSFELFPKCVFMIKFIGCTMRKFLHIIHDATKPITLRSVRGEFSICSIEKMIWSFPQSGIVLYNRHSYSVTVEGRHLKLGLNYVDFTVIMKGDAANFGSAKLSYSYGRCWFKTVPGPFNVGIHGGVFRSVPCTSPLIFRLFSHNINYPESQLISIWRCVTNTGYKLEPCGKQRFLGSKIFYPTLPCNIDLWFTAVVLHTKSGRKINLQAGVHTNIHVDSLNCHCSHNCYPAIDPRSKTIFWTDDHRLSTNTQNNPIRWSAWLTHQRLIVDLQHYVVPESLGSVVEIDKFTFSKFPPEAMEDPILFVRAEKNDLYCEMILILQVPFPPIITIDKRHIYSKDIEDYRNHLIIINYNALLLDQPCTFVALEQIAPGILEPIESIRASRIQFSYLRMDLPTAVVAESANGMDSEVIEVYSPKKDVRNYTEEEIEKMMRLTNMIVDKGDLEIAITELTYISRFVMQLPEPPLRLRRQILKCLDTVSDLMFTAGVSRVSSNVQKVLRILNRVTVSNDMTRPPFNLSVYPWVVPSNNMTPTEVEIWNELRLSASSIVLKICTLFHGSSKESNPKSTSVVYQLFGALLRYTLSRLWEPFRGKLVLSSPQTNDLEYNTQNAQMHDTFDKSVNFLLRAIRHQLYGYEDDLTINIGTVTLKCLVLFSERVHWIGLITFNKYQEVTIRITLPDEDARGDSPHNLDSTYLGVYVELPYPNEMTTRVHIALFNPWVEEEIPSKIAVQMKVQKMPKNITDGNWIVDYVRKSSSREIQQRYIVVYLVTSSDSDIVTDNVQRYLTFHIANEVDVKFHVDSDVPKYENISRSQEFRQGAFNVSMVTDRQQIYLSFIPGEKVQPGIPRKITFDSAGFVCTLRPSSSVAAGNSDDKELCNIIAGINDTKDPSVVTCVCPGPGIFDTFTINSELIKVLTDDPSDSERSAQWDFSILPIWMMPVILLAIYVVSSWRDKRSHKREFIQVLEDSLPGDSHPYIIGVFTGTKMFAGTGAKVAFQMHGSISSSRVHILQSKSFQTLKWAHDDWFLLYTKEHLGHKLQLCLWQNFQGHCPNWRCTHIVIYDVEEMTWYGFSVNRWIRISEGVQFCRAILVRGHKFTVETINLMTFTFLKHYKRLLRNASSLFSVFFKHRRHVFSYRQKALLLSVFILSLVCSSLIIEDSFIARRSNTEINVFFVALISLLPAFLLLAVVTCIFTRSYVKTRKTQKLDLRKLHDMKILLAGSPVSAVTYTGKPDKTEHWDMKSIQTTHSSRLSSSSRSSHSGKKRHGSPNSVFRKSSSVRKHFQHERAERSIWRSDTTWHQKSVIQRWTPDAAFRPMRFDHGYIRYGGIAYLIIGWLLAVTIIVLGLVYLILHASIHNGQYGPKVESIFFIAVALEVLFLEPVVFLALSLYSVYYLKVGNFESNILELGGLPENRKQIRHKEFLKILTQPWYFPQPTTRLERLYKQNRNRQNLTVFLCFLLILVFFFLPLVWLGWQNDFYNIWRILNSATLIMREPVKNVHLETVLDPLSKIHEVGGIATYLLTVSIPATSQKSWYNGRPMNTGIKAFKWFIDRHSKLYGSTVIRVMRATNNSRMIVHPLFDQYYAEAFGQFDPNMNKTALISDWHEVSLGTSSSPTLDTMISNGIYGKSGTFYQQSVGQEVFLREEKKERSLGIYKVLKTSDGILTRAMIVDINVLHPVYTQRGLSPPYGVTSIQILFENAGAGPYSAKIQAALDYAPSSKINFSYFTVTLTSAIFLVFSLYVAIRAFEEGFVTLFIVRNMIMVASAILSLAVALVIFTYYINSQVDADVVRSIDINSHLKFMRHIGFIAFLNALIGFLYLSLSLLLNDFLAEFIGMKGRFKSWYLQLMIVAYWMNLFLLKCVELNVTLFDVVWSPRMSMIRVYAKSFDYESPMIYVYGFVWFSTVAIAIASFEKGFDWYSRPEVCLGFSLPLPCFPRLRPKKLSKKFSVLTRGPSIHTTKSEEDKKLRSEDKENQEEHVPSPTLSDKLPRIFRLWE